MNIHPARDLAPDCRRICLGTMTWGEQNSESEAHSQLDLALERGVNFLDTAEIYPVMVNAKTSGRTESYIGSWLKARRCRDRIVIATKVAGPANAWLSHIRDGPRLDRDHIIKACESSRRRLGVDCIDLYQIHWPARPPSLSGNVFSLTGYNYDAPAQDDGIEQILDTLAELIERGWVREVGVSNETPWGLMRYLALAGNGRPRIRTIQNAYSLMTRNYEIGLSEISHREDVGLLAYSPLAFGVLSGKYLDGGKPKGSRLDLWGNHFSRYTTERGQRATRAYRQIAREHGLDPAQMALAFVWSRPFVTASIIGATSLEQLQSNIDAAELKLSAEVLQDIAEVHQRDPSPCP